MRERIIEFFRSQSISFLFFLIGAAAGFVFAIVAYFIFASKKRKVRKGVTPVATEEIASTAADDYDAARTGMDFKAKSKVFFALLSTSITDLSEEYYDEKTKRYAVIGQGISPEALPYVFQRFYKEDRSRGLHARGAGLGLNICKVLVNLSGGQIRVESQQGEWCRFVFTLPSQAPNPGGMKRLPDEAGGAPAVEDPASMKPVE